MCGFTLGPEQGEYIHCTGVNVVHTARRTYRLNGPVKSLDRDFGLLSGKPLSWEVD